jgi:hypothetical protein
LRRITIASLGGGCPTRRGCSERARRRSSSCGDAAGKQRQRNGKQGPAGHARIFGLIAGWKPPMFRSAALVRDDPLYVAYHDHE